MGGQIYFLVDRDDIVVLVVVLGSFLAMSCAEMRSIFKPLLHDLEVVCRVVQVFYSIIFLCFSVLLVPFSCALLFTIGVFVRSISCFYFHFDIFILDFLVLRL